MRITVKPVLAALALVLVTAACTEDDSPAPAATHTRSTSGRVHHMPENFADYVEDCDGHGHRVFMSTSFDNPIVVVNDPTCTEGK